MRVYVGNLPYTTTEDDLRNLFAPYANLKSVSIVTDRDTGRSRGFGFVDIEDAKAVHAIEQLNQTDFGGRNLVVNEAKERNGGRNGIQDRPGRRRDW